MPVMTILLSVIALLIGAIVGWVSASARKTGAIQRALAERDLARAERERSEAVALEARRLANAESQLRVAAETQSAFLGDARKQDRKSTRLNSSHANISYAVFWLKKKTEQ